MKKLLAALLFSSMAMANWYQLKELNCNFTNGTALRYSLNNPSMAIGSLGYITKTYKTDSKVVYSLDQSKSDLWWMLEDASAKYQLHFSSLTPKTIKLNQKMYNIPTTMTAFVPMMVPVWYPVASSKVVAAGSCSVILENWTY